MCKYSTKELINFMNCHRRITRVDIPITSDAVMFWPDFAVSVNNNPKSEISAVRINNFAKTDDLSFVNKKGKLLKRFAKWYKSEYDEEISNGQMGILGDILQYHIQESGKPMFVDFTDIFDWEDGQFGKSGSCYWGLYSESIPTLQEGGG